MAAKTSYPETVRLSDDVLREIERNGDMGDSWDEAARKALGLE